MYPSTQALLNITYLLPFSQLLTTKNPIAAALQDLPQTLQGEHNMAVVCSSG